MGAGASQQSDNNRTVQLRESPSAARLQPSSPVPSSASPARVASKPEWQFLDESLVWTAFPADVSSRLEQSWSSKVPSCQVLFANNRLSTVDLVQMKQRIPGGAERDVRRILVADVPHRAPIDPFADEGDTALGFASPLRTASSGLFATAGSATTKLPADFPVRCVETARIAAHKSSVYACAFSPDGKKILTGARDGSTKYWELETCFIQTNFDELEASILSCTLSRSSDIGAVGCDDGMARIAKLDQPTFHLTLDGHSHKVYGVCFAARDRKLYTGSMDCDARQWDVQTGECLRVSAGTHTSSIFFAAASPTNDWLLLTAGDDCVMVQHDFRLKTTPVARFCGHAETLWGCDVRFDDGMFATCGMDSKVMLWDPRSPAAPLRSFQHRSAVHAVEFMPDGNTLLSCGRDHCFRVTDAQTGETLANQSAHAGYVYRVTYNAVTSRVMTSGGDSLVKLWKLENAAEEQ